MNKRTSEKSGNSDSADSVHSVQNQLPNSSKVYIPGNLHPDIRVPFREITLVPTKSVNGEIEVNEPVRVYDTSGPWGDPDVDVDVTRGLPPLRAKWIRARSDVEEYEGRTVSFHDDGFFSEAHAKSADSRNGFRRSTLNSQPSTAAPRRPLRARAGHAVTQLGYARQGIITPEMEFIAIRENGSQASRLSGAKDDGSQASRLSGAKDDSRDGYLPN